jgi:hypothetical protein
VSAGQDITLVVARMKSATRRQLDEAGVTDAIGAEHFHPTVRAAVAACGEDRRTA